MATAVATVTVSIESAASVSTLGFPRQPPTETPNQLLNCPAPAKLNLFLHITGVRADGYHLLQTVFQLLEYGDQLHFTLRDDGNVRRLNCLEGVAEEDDLTVRAARLLQQALADKQAPSLSITTGLATTKNLGVDITIDKRLPMGGGLGGGSSDAATALMALNHLWRGGLSRVELMAIGLKLGADVPFFLFGRNAFAEGIGDLLTAVATPSCWYVIIEPGINVPTQGIFQSPYLTRNTKAVRIADFSGTPFCFGKNDLQQVVTEAHSQVAEAIQWLTRFGNARMTGSGACVFCAFPAEDQADAALDATLAKAASRPRWRVWKSKSLEQHPLAFLQQT
jgi:4-diphosphocytidyl-2-C-methyl-D-erythritol kinase